MTLVMKNIQKKQNLNQQALVYLYELLKQVCLLLHHCGTQYNTDSQLIIFYLMLQTIITARKLAYRLAQTFKPN